VNGKGMNAAREFGCKRFIYHAVPLQPGLSFEQVRHNINAEVSLSARPVPGMALMLVRFIQNLKALRRESLGQLLCDQIGGSHAGPLRVRAARRSNGLPALRRSLEGVTGKSA
jgi:hypothetical protein